MTKIAIVTPNYYIPRIIMPSWLTLIVGYYTCELVLVLNLTTVDSEFECNQLLILLEQLCNLYWRPLHRSGSQQPIEPMEAIVTLVVVQQI